ncbi:MAG: FeoC-like transcriptional regulator [Gammaproteobacteria bacterium]|nr:FeoC-like transcriptional regulator [Gammaproteobacteria bacterium]
MILADIKNYMIEHRVASINDLTNHFESDADTMREMLAIWIRKGKVRVVEDHSVKCNKCVQCQMLTTEMYEWID